MNLKGDINKDDKLYLGIFVEFFLFLTQDNTSTCLYKCIYKYISFVQE